MYIFNHYTEIFGLLMTVCASLFMYSVVISRRASLNDTLKQRVRLIMFLQDAGITMFYVCTVYALINFFVKVAR